MPVYKWRQRPTRHFGRVWVPFAHLELQGTDGRFQAFALQIDSGATVSLLRRSVAELLGFRLESGQRIDVTGVGGSKTTAFVHELQTRLDDKWPLFTIPFAISSVESVPNLLGRLGVFDQFQVDFDASLRETRLTEPWLDEVDRNIWEFLIETEQHILSRLPDADLAPAVREAVRRMIRRASLLVASAAGLVKLHCPYSAPLFIRALFEVAAQFEYMMQEPEARAQQYIDYEHITKYQQQQCFLEKADGPIGHMLRSSPRRKEGEARIKAEFDRVRSQFEGKKGKLHQYWHGMTLRRLVAELGTSEADWEVEYELWYSKFSAWAHANPLEASRPDRSLPSKGSSVLMRCYVYYARMLLRVSQEMVLTDEQYQFLGKLAQEWK